MLIQVHQDTVGLQYPVLHLILGQQLARQLLEFGVGGRGLSHDIENLIEPHALQQAVQVLMGRYQRRQQANPILGQDRQLGQQAQGGAVDIVGFGQVDDDGLETQGAENLLDIGIQRGAQRQAHIANELEDESTFGLSELNPACCHHSGFLLNSNTEISSGITLACSSPSSCMKVCMFAPACSTSAGNRSSFSFRVVPSTQSSTPSEHSVSENVGGSGNWWFSYSASSNSPTGRPLPCRYCALPSATSTGSGRCPPML